MCPAFDETASRPSRRRVLRWAGATALAASATPFVSACADRPGSGDADSGHVSLIHAAKDPLVLYAVTYLAEDKGFYKQEGLTVKRVLLAGGPPALAGLLTRAGQVNLSTPGELLAAVSKGQRLRTLMAHTNTPPAMLVVSERFARRIGVTATSPLAQRQRAIGTVKGGRYGVNAPGSLTDGLTRLALRRAGVDPAHGARIVPLQSASNCLAALANGQIDGFVANPPLGEKAVRDFRAVPLLLNQTGEIAGGDRLQGITMEARAQDVQAHPDLYKALVRADTRALRTLVEDPTGSGELLRRTRFGALPEPIFTYAWELVQKSWGSPIVTRDSLRGWFDVGLVPDGHAGDFPFDKVVDMSFVDQALTSLRWQPARKA